MSIFRMMDCSCQPHWTKCSRDARARATRYLIRTLRLFKFLTSGLTMLSKGTKEDQVETWRPECLVSPMNPHLHLQLEGACTCESRGQHQLSVLPLAPSHFYHHTIISIKRAIKSLTYTPSDATMSSFRFSARA